MKELKQLFGRRTVGFALSGGGTRGAFHIGLLKALEEQSIKIDAVAGTSIGSLVGAFYCAGHGADKMLELIKEQSIFNLFRIRIGRSGLMEPKGFKKMLHKYLPATFDELPIPLHVAITDLNADDPMIVENGDLRAAVLASCSVPIIFRTVEFEGKECVDGGLLNNMPADALHRKVDKIVGVHINKYQIPEDDQSIDTLADRIFSLVIRQSVIRSKDFCDYFIEPELPYASVLDFKNLDEFFELGHQFGVEFLKHPNSFIWEKPGFFDRVANVFR